MLVQEKTTPGKPRGTTKTSLAWIVISQSNWTALTALLEHDLFFRVEPTKSGVGTFLGVLGVIGGLTRRF